MSQEMSQAQVLKPVAVSSRKGEARWWLGSLAVIKAALRARIPQIPGMRVAAFEELGGVPVVPGEPVPAASYPDPEEFARASRGASRSSDRRRRLVRAMSTTADIIAEHRRTSYELWEPMARPWERRRSLTWRFNPERQ